MGKLLEPATNKDAMTGFQLYHAIVYCPEMDIKLYSFVDQLLSSESKRTLIQSSANLFHSEVLKNQLSDRYHRFAKLFYMDLATTLNLQYGNILLTTSTNSQLQDLIDIDAPFLTNSTDEVKTCILDSKCDILQDFIGDQGITLHIILTF